MAIYVLIVSKLSQEYFMLFSCTITPAFASRPVRIQLGTIPIVICFIPARAPPMRSAIGRLRRESSRILTPANHLLEIYLETRNVTLGHFHILFLKTIQISLQILNHTLRLVYPVRQPHESPRDVDPTPTPRSMKNNKFMTSQSTSFSWLRHEPLKRP